MKKDRILIDPFGQKSLILYGVVFFGTLLGWHLWVRTFNYRDPLFRDEYVSGVVVAKSKKQDILFIREKSNNSIYKIQVSEYKYMETSIGDSVSGYGYKD